MSIAEFWEEEPDLLWAYRKSYMERFKLQKETINMTAWLNGLYVFDAISTALYNAFAKSGTQPRSYVEKPIEIGLTQEDIEKRKRQELEDNIRKSLNRKKELIKSG